MAPSKISAEAGSILKVIGTSTATAIVAVKPGIDPIIVPATTPNNANAMLVSVNAARKLSISKVHPVLMQN
jgi:uncharacterized membrane protein AbrB (regulator of aidB expression)